MIKRVQHIIVFVLLLITAGKTAAQQSMPDTVCKGTVRTYSVNDPSVPSTYTWKVNGVVQSTTTNSLIITWNNVGTYQITVQERSAAGCLGDEQSGFVYVMPLPVRVMDTVVCANVFPYSWNGVNITGAGTYNYITKGAYGCDSTTTLNVSTIAVSTSVTTDSICSNLIPYRWNGQSYTASGTYSVRLTNAAGCDSIATLNLLVKPSPLLLINQPQPVCEPNTVDLTAPSITAGSDPGLAFTYWMDSAATIPLTNPKNVSASGTYYIKVVGANNCISTKPVAVTVLIYRLIPGIRYAPISAQSNTATQLSSRNIGIAYNWSPPVGLNSPIIKDPVFNFDKQTEYVIQITRDNGCITSDTLLVKVYAAPIPIVKSDLFVPKAWSPNNDGHNDKLYPLTVNIRELKYFRVFNRWGQLVFETNAIGQGWDGIFNGKPQVMDVYTWTAEAIGVDGKVIKKSGNSVLIR